jgi:hypothetical protein
MARMASETELQRQVARQHQEVRREEHARKRAVEKQAIELRSVANDLHRLSADEVERRLRVIASSTRAAKGE